jgi:hypothetical protein
MHPSQLFALLALAASSAVAEWDFKASPERWEHFKEAAGVLSPDVRRDLEPRGCRWASCNDCYEGESNCQLCASGNCPDEGCALAACIVWWVVLLLLLLLPQGPGWDRCTVLMLTLSK